MPYACICCIISTSWEFCCQWMCYVLLCCWLCSGVWVFSSACLCLKNPANPFQFRVWNKHSLVTSCWDMLHACLATIMINCKTAVQKQHTYACIWSASSNRVSLWMCYVLLCCWLCSGVWVFSSACLKKPANPRLFQFWIWNNPCCFYSNFTVNVHVAK